MIVMKFGGSSVGSAEMMDKALDIAVSRLESAPVVVSSAMSKVTDSLLMMTDLAVTGDGNGAMGVVEKIIQRHLDLAESFLSGKNLAQARERIEGMRRGLLSLAKGLSLLKECSPRSSDAVVSYGELLSTTLLAARARERGLKADLADSRTFMRTDDRFMSAAPDFRETRKLTRRKLKPAPGRLVICQGFIGSTRDGVTTTLGRGGSDYSATIIGAALGAETVEIWTDVSGILTTDPRLVPEARSIPKISYGEAAELAYFGAKVVHPSSIQPAVEQGIPVFIKNTNDPAHPGTVILAETRGRGLRAIAFKKKVTLINVISTRMLNAYGFLNRIFTVFEKHKTSVDLVATSEVSVTMSVENTAYLKSIVRDLEEFSDVDIRRDKATICLVGRDVWEEQSFFVRVFQALRDIPVKLISLGASNINLSFVVMEENCDEAVRLLHREFFEKSS